MTDDVPSPPRAAEIRLQIRARYASVAVRPEGQFAYPVGRTGALGLGYERAWLDAVPEAVVRRFVGVGNPLGLRRPARGDRLLDVGCGSGLDVFVAAGFVGPGGMAVGIDATPAMLAVAAPTTPGGACLLAGDAERLPFDDASFDVVISNGALNLALDKHAVFRELHRVLVPGGTLAVADLLVTGALDPAALPGVDAWST